MKQHLLMGAFLCGSCLGAFAEPSLIAPAQPVLVAPFKLPLSLTSLNISYPNVARGESVKLLDAKVSLKVKEASFLSVLDGLLCSAGSTCNVEARGVKAMKLSLDLKDAPAGPLLDGLAKAGGARLWVFATKLLIAPASLLTKEEKKEAKLYGVLVSKETLPADSALREAGKSADPLDVANTKISIDINNLGWNEVWGELMKAPGKPNGVITNAPASAWDGITTTATISASFQDVSYAEALAFVAHANGCELYLVPDMKYFIVCPPGEMAPQYKAQAVPAFTAASTHFDFGSNPNFDPSAKGS